MPSTLERSIQLLGKVRLFASVGCVFENKISAERRPSHRAESFRPLKIVEFAEHRQGTWVWHSKPPN